MKRFDKIVAGFKKTIAQLDELVHLNERQIEDNLDSITVLQEQNLELTAEKQAALNVSHNLRRMLEGDA